MKITFLAAIAIVAVLLAPYATRAETISGLQDVVVGSDGTYTAAPTFSSKGAQYAGLTDPFSDGFTVSNHNDTTDYGDNAFQHLYNAIPGHGSGGSSQYAVASAFAGTSVALPADPVSIDIINTTYAYYSMLHGDQFAKKFGGASGSDPDFFLLTITGLNAANSPVGSVPFYLADFRPTVHAQDYLVSQWTTVNLSSLVGARKLAFSLSSSDNGQFGMNTPAFFAVDNLRYASPLVLADMNGDGRLDNFDIGPFELALTDLNAYRTAYPGVSDYVNRGDTNLDGRFDNFDIGAFELLLTSGAHAAAVPEPSSLALAAVALLSLAGRRVSRRHASRLNP